MDMNKKLYRSRNDKMVSGVCTRSIELSRMKPTNYILLLPNHD